MKTVTLWNVPVEIAKETAKAMRKMISQKVLTGATQETIYNLMYDVERMEEAIRIAEHEPVEPEE